MSSAMSYCIWNCEAKSFCPNFPSGLKHDPTYLMKLQRKNRWLGEINTTARRQVCNEYFFRVKVGWVFSRRNGLAALVMVWSLHVSNCLWLETGKSTSLIQPSKAPREAQCCLLVHQLEQLPPKLHKWGQIHHHALDTVYNLQVTQRLWFTILCILQTGKLRHGSKKSSLCVEGQGLALELHHSRMADSG